MSSLAPSFFADTIQHSLTLCDAVATPRDVPEAFRDSLFERSSGDLQISCRAYGLTAHGEHRMVSIHSSKIEILIWFFYPQPQWRLPVYAMQFVRLSGKPMIGVLDLPSLHGADPALATLMQSHILSAVDEPYHPDIPEWYAQCRSGYDLFTRPRDNASFSALAEAHVKALHSLHTLSLRPFALPAAEVAAHARQITAYKQHHHQNSPGLSLLNTICGKEWTARFMNEWLFAD